MLTSHTSSEEEKILYLRKSAQNITNNNKVLSCLKIALTSVRFIASCDNVVLRFQTSPILPFPPHPPDGSLNSLKETLPQPVLKSFITVVIIMKG